MITGNMDRFTTLAIKSADELLFGRAPRPVTCGCDLLIGNGLVFPEINFTLPSMKIEEDNWPEVRRQYTEIADAVLARAVKLNVPGLVVEFEQLPPMSGRPQWGAEITALLKNKLKQFYDDSGIPNALRVTIVDLRDADRPPLLRKGQAWQKTREAFVMAAQAGADILSIESVGGKEVHDQALVYGDLAGITAALGILSCRDMAFLWDEISSIAAEYQIISGGDTACGFSNTAMQLAGKGMIPTLLAALDRAASAARSLVAYEHGAVGPSKDCAYEGPIIKAISGCPISMEGKSSSCAHFSPLGNIAAAAADLWSNESVQNIRLLSGNAPEAFMELLSYDCRLFNMAGRSGQAQTMRDWLVQSDVSLSVEALMLEPETVIRIAEAIVREEGGYARTVAAVRSAFDCIQENLHQNKINLPAMEAKWLEQLESVLLTLPQDEGMALDYLKQTYGTLFSTDAYNL